MMDSIIGGYYQVIMNKTWKILARPHLLEARANEEGDELEINSATDGMVRVIFYYSTNITYTATTNTTTAM